jgi:hypothetical protein
VLGFTPTLGQSGVATHYEKTFDFSNLVQQPFKHLYYIKHNQKQMQGKTCS